MSDALLELLREADPVGDLDRLPAPDAPDVVALREEILARSTDATPVVDDLELARRRRTRRAAVAVAAVVAVATAAALLVTTRRPPEPTSLGCYLTASTDGDTTVLARSGDDPVGPCRDLWEAGEMDPAVTTPAQVPPLVACVLPTGPVGVFPTGSCDEVEVATGRARPLDPDARRPSPDAPSDDGAAASPDDATSTPEGATDPAAPLAMPDYDTADADARAALDQVRRALLDTCASYDEARRLTEQALADNGVEGWQVAPIGDHTDATCAGFFPDAPNRRVLFTADPRPGGG